MWPSLMENPVSYGYHSYRLIGSWGNFQCRTSSVLIFISLHLLKKSCGTLGTKRINASDLLLIEAFTIVMQYMNKWCVYCAMWLFTDLWLTEALLCHNIYVCTSRVLDLSNICVYSIGFACMRSCAPYCIYYECVLDWQSHYVCNNSVIYSTYVLCLMCMCI